MLDNYKYCFCEELLRLREILRSVQLTNQSDRALWKQENSGKFSCKSFYKFIKTGPIIDLNIKHIWKVKVPPRMKIFASIMSQDNILIADNLKNKKELAIAGDMLYVQITRRDCESSFQ
jgi:zinc-binding in reverse transcriptase